MRYKAVEVLFMLGSSFMSPPRPKFVKINIDLLSVLFFEKHFWVDINYTNLEPEYHFVFSEGLLSKFVQLSIL